MLLAALSLPAGAESISVVLDHNTSLQGSQYQEIAIEGEYALAYSGQGLYSLDFAQQNPVQGNGTSFQLKSADDSSLSLSFSDLTHLSFSGEDAEMPARWSGPVNLNNLGDARFTVENISGDVSFSHFSGNSIVQSIVHVWSQSSTGGTEARIRIADVSGKLQINNNTSTGCGDMFVSMGMLARVSPRGEGVSDAIIEISGIGNGVEITGNTRGGSAGFAGLIATVNTGLGLSSITLSDIRGGIRVTDNQTSDYGIFSSVAGSSQWDPPDFEVITGEAAMSITGVQGDILFQQNSAYGSGGLTLVGCQCKLDISGIDGNVYFIDNSSSVGAGAIYCAPAPKDTDPQRSSVRLSADGGDIVFQGNKNTGENIANAMIVGANTDVRLNASEGRTIAFYDPVVIDDDANASTVHLNEGASTGEILFSGELYADSDNADNYTSYWGADVIQYNGTVRLESKATVLMDSYVQEQGVLVMEGGAGLATSEDMTLKQLVVRPGREEDGPVGLVCEGTFSLTGSLTLEGDFGNMPGTSILEINAENVAAMPEKTTFTQDGIVYTADLRWDPEGNLTLISDDIKPTEVLAEYSGADVANAMLSTANNLHALKTGAMNHLESARLRSVGKGNWWADGLGSFSMQRTKAGREGYDFQGGGYAIGGEYRVSRDWVVGGIFGQIFGKNISRDKPSVNRQETIMGMLEAAWARPIGKHSAVTVTGGIGYGSTDNELKSSFSDGRASRGDWNNRAFLGVLKGEWQIELSKGYVLKPGLGLEYTDVLQNAFTETGDSPRRFDKGHYRNLSLPVSIALQKSFALGNGKVWDNMVSVSYVPDVYRHDAESTASRNNYAWKASGSKPARNGVRVGLFSRLSWNASWSVTGGYQLEVRSDNVYQTCSAGLEYSF